MIRPIHIFLFFCFQFPVVFASAQNSLPDFNLKGKVKKITDEEWEMRDSSGHTIRKKIKGLGLTGRTTVFDTSGYIVSVTDNDSIHGKNVYYKTYKKPGQVLSIQYLGRDGSKNISKFEYEKIGEKTTTYLVNEKGERSVAEENFKNDKNRIVKTIGYNAPDSVSMTTEYVYDEAGNVVQLTNTYRNGHKETWGWQWKNGIKVQGLKTVFEKEKKTSVTSCVYDNANHIVREFVKEYTGKPNHGVIYVYTFDAKGNWTTREIFRVEGQKRNLAFFAERNIVYFE